MQMTLCTCLECKVFTTFTQKINYYVFTYFSLGEFIPDLISCIILINMA